MCEQVKGMGGVTHSRRGGMGWGYTIAKGFTGHNFYILGEGTGIR